MLFQALDNKSECAGVYVDGQLCYNDMPENLSETWSYSNLLKQRKDIEYAYLYCGKPIEEICPERFRERFDTCTDKLKAFLRSFQISKIDMNDNCFYDMVPPRFLLEYCEIKNKITKHILDNYEKPENYDFLVDLAKVIEEIRYQKLNLNTSNLLSCAYKYKTRQFMKKIKHI